MSFDEDLPHRVTDPVSLSPPARQGGIANLGSEALKYLSLLPVFQGPKEGLSLESWLEDVQCLHEQLLLPWPLVKLIVRLRVSGIAKTWYIDHEPEFMDMDSFVRLIRHEYSSDDSMASFQGRLPSENIGSYNRRFMEAHRGMLSLARANPGHDLEGYLKNLYLNHLNNDLLAVTIESGVEASGLNDITRYMQMAEKLSRRVSPSAFSSPRQAGLGRSPPSNGDRYPQPAEDARPWRPPPPPPPPPRGQQQRPGRAWNPPPPQPNPRVQESDPNTVNHLADQLQRLTLQVNRMHQQQSQGPAPRADYHNPQDNGRAVRMMQVLREETGEELDPYYELELPSESRIFSTQYRRPQDLEHATMMEAEPAVQASGSRRRRREEDSDPKVAAAPSVGPLRAQPLPNPVDCREGVLSRLFDSKSCRISASEALAISSDSFAQLAADKLNKITSAKAAISSKPTHFVGAPLVPKTQEDPLRSQCRRQHLHRINTSSSGGAAGMPRLDVLVNGKRVSSIIDTGAVSSLINKACLARCGLLDDLQPSDCLVQGVHGTPVKADLVHTTVSLGRANIKMPLLTIDSPDSGFELLLGLDFAGAYGASIDFETKSITLRLGAGDMMRVPFTRSALRAGPTYYITVDDRDPGPNELPPIHEEPPIVAEGPRPESADQPPPQPAPFQLRSSSPRALDPNPLNGADSAELQDAVPDSWEDRDSPTYPWGFPYRADSNLSSSPTMSEISREVGYDMPPMEPQLVVDEVDEIPGDSDDSDGELDLASDSDTCSLPSLLSDTDSDDEEDQLWTSPIIGPAGATLEQGGGVQGADGQRPSESPLRVLTAANPEPPLDPKDQLMPGDKQKIKVEGYPEAFVVGNGLPSHMIPEFKQLMQDNRDAFCIDLSDLAEPSKVPPVDIQTGDSKPVYIAPYRRSPKEVAILEKLTLDLYKAGIVEPSQSAWSNPAMIVPKPFSGDPDKLTVDQKWRHVVDYRQLNQACIQQGKAMRWPIPLTQDCQEAASAGTLHTIIDLKCGFNQLPLTEESKPKTAFIVGGNVWQYRRLPMGLTSAPAYFVAAVNKALAKGIQEGYVRSFFDDILISTPAGETDADTARLHMYHVQQVLQMLAEANLRAAPHKCFLFTERVKFVGSILERGTIRPDPNKLRAVANFPPPQDTTSLMSFLGLVGYYSRHLRSYSTKTYALRILLRKGSPWVWGPDQQDAFDSLKRELLSGAVVWAPDWSLPFILQTDYSSQGLAAVLSQRDNDGKERLITCASRSCTPAESRLSATEGELRALIYGVTYMQPYLFGQRFTVETDHSALAYLHKFKDRYSKLARAAVLLQGFDFEVVHRKGKSNGNADALSRTVPTENDWEAKELDDFCPDLPEVDGNQLATHSPPAVSAGSGGGTEMPGEGAQSTTHVMQTIPIFMFKAPLTQEEDHRVTPSVYTGRTALPSSEDDTSLDKDYKGQDIVTHSTCSDSSVPSSVHPSEEFPQDDLPLSHRTRSRLRAGPPQVLITVVEDEDSPPPHEPQPQGSKRLRPSEDECKTPRLRTTTDEESSRKETQSTLPKPPSRAPTSFEFTAKQPPAAKSPLEGATNPELALAPHPHSKKGMSREYTCPQREVWDDLEAMAYLMGDRDPQDTSRMQQLSRLLEHYEYCDGVLTYRSRIVPPPEVRERIIMEAHEQLGHRGYTGVLDLLKYSYAWPKMAKAVKERVSSCQSCRDRTYKPLADPVLRPLPLPEFLSRGAMDLMGPFPESDQGHSRVVVYIDYYSKFVTAQPIADKTSDTIRKFLRERIIYVFGKPVEIVCDQGLEFRGELERECQTHGIKLSHGAPYCPETQGLVERAVQTLTNGLRSHLATNPSFKWEEYLPQCVAGMNFTKQRTIGYSPFFMTFGVHPRLPINVSDLVHTENPSGSAAANPEEGKAADPKEDLSVPTPDPQLAQRTERLNQCHRTLIENVGRAQARQVREFAKRRRTASALPPVGSKVWIRQQRGTSRLPKFAPKWIGPFQISAYSEDRSAAILKDAFGRTWREKWKHIATNSSGEQPGGLGDRRTQTAPSEHRPRDLAPVTAATEPVEP